MCRNKKILHDKIVTAEDEGLARTSRIIKLGIN